MIEILLGYVVVAVGVALASFVLRYLRYERRLGRVLYASLLHKPPRPLDQFARGALWAGIRWPLTLLERLGEELVGIFALFAGR